MSGVQAERGRQGTPAAGTRPGSGGATAGGTSRHLRKRSFQLAGHRTSVALEPAFWEALEALAAARALSLAALVAQVDAARTDARIPLASALRVHALRERAAMPAAAPPASEG